MFQRAHTAHVVVIVVRWEGPDHFGMQMCKRHDLNNWCLLCHYHKYTSYLYWNTLLVSIFDLTHTEHKNNEH